MLLGNGFRQCSTFGFSVQWFLSSLVGTFQLQLLSRINWLPTAEYVKVKIKFMLLPTVSLPVFLGGKHPHGATDQILITVRQLRVF
jgi:hypothetical protein